MMETLFIDAHGWRPLLDDSLEPWWWCLVLLMSSSPCTWVLDEHTLDHDATLSSCSPLKILVVLKPLVEPSLPWWKASLLLMMPLHVWLAFWSPCIWGLILEHLMKPLLWWWSPYSCCDEALTYIALAHDWRSPWNSWCVEEGKEALWWSPWMVA